MAKIILFGGGDGGGIRITSSGIEPIPPFDPLLRYQLSAANFLVKAAQRGADKAGCGPLGEIVNKLTTTILTQLESVVGEIDAENGFIYQDDDGGFVCGSTGKPPIPFPWPVDPRRSITDLLSRGVLNDSTLKFLEQAGRQKFDVFTVARDPKSAAEKIGVTLTPEVEKTLKSLKLDKDKPEDKTDREVIEFYRKIVTDGRYISEVVTNPEGAARKLKMPISREALDRIITTRNQGIFGPAGPGAAMSPAAVAVAIAIVIVLWSREVELPVLDKSGINKL